jgi:hypothetical protein
MNVLVVLGTRPEAIKLAPNMSTFGIHRLDWLTVSKRFPWNAKYETVYRWLASLSAYAYDIRLELEGNYEHLSPNEAVLKTPCWDRPLASKGTNPFLTLSHTPSTNTGFRGERSFGKTFPRIGKRRTTFGTCWTRVPSIGPTTGIQQALKALHR